MKIRLEVEGTPLTATLDGGATARDFASLLPLTLTLEDYASTEKIADLPRQLATTGAPAGCDPDAGDITYYAPWGNLAVFYRDFGYSAGLVKLGRIEAGVDALQQPGSLRVTIERVDDDRGRAMSNWRDEELRRIAGTDDLHVSPFREDGRTYGTPTWIWSVVVDDALYVRAYHGTRSRWYQAALRQKAGRITAAGMTKEVAFEPVDGALGDRIDAAYAEKYRGSPYLASMVGASARAATVRITPREEAAS